PVWFLVALLFAQRLLMSWTELSVAVRVAGGAAGCFLLLSGLHGARDTSKDAQSRSPEVAIGALAREHGARELAIDTPDYGYFAVIAAFGLPTNAAPIDDRDPRKPRAPDPFQSSAAFDAYLRERKPGWLVATRAHAALLTARCSVEEKNDCFVLAR